MIFGASPRTRGGKRATNGIGCSEGSTPMRGDIDYPKGAGTLAKPGSREPPHQSTASASNPFADMVYVLHAFQKKTRQTAKRDVDLAASRLREQVARMR